ncbi:putative T-complex protein 1 subunit theta [Neolecta irregularis DAH-3]|uniref:CCT-theta n=1 Tax=Neolecta irregularis (strain DAH-3) TaxID=1198029 RepID=A0A1U7LS93_NEOID|nr:putative T-complex protein 1 subunit theta [Neolecta irregularis DAH-3]|eukprot:OLL25412.1 putative T-complex protein 1 subunit theta [Neolecta irregularis DAH-3]
MSLKVPTGAGPQLFKQTTNLQGIEDAVIRNIHAVNGTPHFSSNYAKLNYFLGRTFGNFINHLQKLFLTNDAATIIKELDVVHPAAKILVMASQQQESEVYLSKFSFSLPFSRAGLWTDFFWELLKKAESLLTMGLHPSEIIKGYEMAQDYTLKTLNELAIDKVSDTKSKTELAKAIKTAIASKQYGNEDLLSELVAEAVLAVMPKNPLNFNIDNVRVVKVMGSNLVESKVVRGMVFAREPEGRVTKAGRSKVAVYSCGIDIGQTETKGTVLLHNAKEMLEFSKGEEAQMEDSIKQIWDAGVRVVVSGGAIGDLALHFLNRFDILVVKVLSKFDLRRLCRVVGATPLARVGAPMPEEMGNIDIVETVEIGGDRVTVFRQENEVTKTATIVLRGATQNRLDDVERAIDDGVNVVKAIAKDPRLVPGAGATEMELFKRTFAFGEKTPGIFQHVIKKYAEAFEVVPRTLAETAGLDATDVLSKLHAAHHKNDDGVMGVDIDEQGCGSLVDANERGILDVLSAKHWAVRLATDAALTILAVDQIIMSKPAGGPKPPAQKANWDED